MSPLDLNIEYNARKTVLNHEEISARWDVEAARYRAEADAQLDIPYGGTERSKYDFFPAGESRAPVCAYIHGGYWRSRSAKTFSHVAKGLNERGISVAIPSYDLVPNVSLMDIVDQMRAFLVKLWQETGVHPVVMGHSAGGHLTSAMLATDWSKVEGAPGDLVTNAFAVSGIYDLEPLLETDINNDVRLTPETAREASPVHWAAPRAGLKLVAAVGALESGAFRDQTRRLAEVWAQNGFETEFLEIPDRNHFTIVEAVSTPGHMLFERLAAMVESASVV